MTGIRLAEALGALSFATDHAAGQPQGTALGATVLAVRIGRFMGLDDQSLADLYYASVLRRIGCTSTASMAAPLALGDERKMNLALNIADLADGESVRASLSEHLPQADPARRSAAIARIEAMGPDLARVADAHCVQAVTLTRRLPVPSGTVDLLAQIDARWDGKNPIRPAGVSIAAGTRIMEFASIAELHHRAIGMGSALEVASKRAGTQFDPDVAGTFVAHHDDLTAGLTQTSTWDAYLSAEPGVPVEMSPNSLRAVTLAFADFSDRKSRFFLGHSRRVAALAYSAAVSDGLDESLCQSIFNAGLVHDIGRCAVATGIWEKSGELDRFERIEVESHSFHTARILALSSVFADISQWASSVHERCDGSGYHRGIRLDHGPSGLLAAANLYDELTHDTAARQALSASPAAERLNREAADGRLPPESVRAVLRAAGHRDTQPVSLPAGLTKREAEVLRLIASGESGKGAAAKLGIAPKTVEKHTENIFRKIGASNRTAAALFAMEKGLLDR